MQSDVSGLLGSILGLVFVFGMAAFIVAANWKVFTKAGQPGWACLVPIYNFVILLKVVQRPMWWLLLLFIPLAGFVVALVMLFDLAKVFGKGAAFGFGLLFLPFIFYPILAFGESEYQGRTLSE